MSLKVNTQQCYTCTCSKSKAYSIKTKKTMRYFGPFPVTHLTMFCKYEPLSIDTYTACFELPFHKIKDHRVFLVHFRLGL